jgi:hypothetical protein
MIVAALQQLLWNDPRVAPALGPWDFGDGQKRPGVFTTDPAPEAAPNPVVVVTLDAISEWVKARKKAHLVHHVNLRLWGDRQESEKGLRVLAWRLYRLLVTSRLELDPDEGYEHKLTRITAGPERIKDEDGFPGYNFQLEISVCERS